MTSRGFTRRRQRPTAAAPRVGLFGVIGTDNIGNEGMLEAVVSWLKRDHPDATMDFMCTGPEKNLRANPLIASLLAEAIATLDDTNLGLAVNQRSHVLDAHGRPWPNLLAFGPMTRGSFGEMTGAPDIARHIETLSESLFDDIAALEGTAA